MLSSPKSPSYPHPSAKTFTSKQLEQMKDNFEKSELNANIVEKANLSGRLDICGNNQ
jgi:hypothetical protein